MARVIFGAVCVALLAGCGSTRSRYIDAAGMWADQSGKIAIGAVEVYAEEKGDETATIVYDEDFVWLSPDKKLRTVRVRITGTNSTAKVSAVVASLCEAFADVAKTRQNTTQEESER